MAKANDLPPVLQKMCDALSRGPMTATAMIKKFRVPKPTLYARLARLKEALGGKLKERKVRDAAKGPLSTEYSLRAVKRKAG